MVPGVFFFPRLNTPPPRPVHCVTAMTEPKPRTYRHGQLRIPDESDLPLYCAVYNGLYDLYTSRSSTYGEAVADDHTGLIMARGWGIERARVRHRDAEIAKLKKERNHARGNVIKLAATVAREVCGEGDEPLSASEVNKLAENLRRAALQAVKNYNHERKEPDALQALFFRCEEHLVAAASGEAWCRVCNDSLMGGPCQEDCARVMVRRALGLENIP